MFGKKREVYNLLELTPVRVHNHEEVNGLVNILIPKFKNEFMKKLIPKNKPQDIRIKLDELGSVTWLSIDGNKKVKEIIEELKLKMGEKIEPAVDRISKFLGGLNQNNFIYFKELKKGK